MSSHNYYPIPNRKIMIYISDLEKGCVAIDPDTKLYSVKGGERRYFRICRSGFLALDLSRPESKQVVTREDLLIRVDDTYDY